MGLNYKRLYNGRCPRCNRPVEVDGRCCECKTRWDIFRNDQKARRIDSTEAFTMEMTFTAGQLEKLAKKECVSCFGSGVFINEICKCTGIVSL